MSLSLVVPYYDDSDEAAKLVAAARENSERVRQGEVLVVPLERERARETGSGARVLRAPHYGGLPAAKNLALESSRCEFLLYLFPGLVPMPGAIDRLARDLAEHSDWSAVAGRWNQPSGHVEKGYNIRAFPTFKALVFDLLFVHKLFPSNATTRRYKMHDFDHASLRAAEHANDCVFMARRQALVDAGGFDESYRFGWFDQVEICRHFHQLGTPVVYQPAAAFAGTGREPLINRLLAMRYVDFYRDERLFVARRFGPAKARLFSALLVAAMAMRLGFAGLVPAAARNACIRHFRPYVDDRYIQSMWGSYLRLMKAALTPGGLR